MYIYLSVLRLPVLKDKFNTEVLDQREFTFKMFTDIGNLSFQKVEPIYIPNKIVCKGLFCPVPHTSPDY